MHPMIKPALRRGWRDRQTVQYGISPAHAVVVGPVDATTGGFLDLLDGTRSLAQLREAAAAMGLAPDTADRVTRRLAEAGILDDATADRGAARAISDRLRPDLASLSVVHREPGAGLRRLTARRTARVRVRGAGRVGSAIATALSAAGVGQVEVRDGGCVEPWDTAPGGTGPEQQGMRREIAVRRAVRRASPWPPAPREPGQPERGLDLVVIAPRDGLDAYAPPSTVGGELISTGTPHLYAGVVEGTGVVGPLVLPGVSPCAECLMRHRGEREPTWPLVVGQWRSARSTGIPACDTALATVVAGVTAAQVLSFLDGGPICAVGTRTRYVLPTLVGELEPIQAHPECPCDAASSAAFPDVDGEGTTATGTGGAGDAGDAQESGGGDREVSARTPAKRLRAPSETRSTMAG